MSAPTLADRVLAIARREADEGVCESGGPNCGTPSLRYMGGRQEPWCSHFVAWCFRKAGRPLPGDVEPSPTRAAALAGVAHMERVFEEHGWLVREPQRGDVVFFRARGQSDPGRGRHVGIVERVTPTLLHIVDGNWKDRVYRRAILRSDTTIAGFARVPDIDK